MDTVVNRRNYMIEYLSSKLNIEFVPEKDVAILHHVTGTSIELTLTDLTTLYYFIERNLSDYLDEGIV